MRYVDIKDHVVRVDKTLGQVPIALLWELMTGLPDIDSTILEVELPGTYCIVHAHTEEMFNYRMVCTVVMGDVPTFFFVAAGGEEWDDYSYRILSRDATMALIKYLVDTHIERCYQRIALTEVEVVDEVPELTSYYGEEIVYGSNKGVVYL